MSDLEGISRIRSHWQKVEATSQSQERKKRQPKSFHLPSEAEESSPGTDPGDSSKQLDVRI